MRSHRSFALQECTELKWNRASPSINETTACSWSTTKGTFVVRLVSIGRKFLRTRLDRRFDASRSRSWNSIPLDRRHLTEFRKPPLRWPNGVSQSSTEGTIPRARTSRELGINIVLVLLRVSIRWIPITDERLRRLVTDEIAKLKFSLRLSYLEYFTFATHRSK